MARSNFSTASSYLCWSNNSSPLEIRERISAQSRLRNDYDIYSLIILRLASLWEGFERPPEGRHAVRNVARLVLRDSQLDVAENELVI